MVNKTDVVKLASSAKESAAAIAVLDASEKNKLILAMAESLQTGIKTIISANKKDIKKAREKKLKKPLIDRLTLDEKRIEGMADSLKVVASLEDPVGQIENMDRRPNGLLIGKMRVPIGVIFIIYESRPNVTSDCVGLCIKSGNAVILRGGSEAINSNTAIFNILDRCCKSFGLPKSAITLVKNTDRKAVDILLQQRELIDLVIPRGGEGLINAVSSKSKIPVIKHYKGVCHTFVDEFANLNMAQRICINAKVQRPGVCNAMETLLVHEDVAARFLPGIIRELKQAGVEIRGCKKTKTIVKTVKAASEKDWSEEYLDLILSVKVVASLNEAITHIGKYGSMHSDTIVTENLEHAMSFLRRVDSACVYVNASTRFTDGGQYGMGAEMGISTEKLHARGPMGLKELTTYKYVVFGKGQVRE